MDAKKENKKAKGTGKHTNEERGTEKKRKHTRMVCRTTSSKSARP
jgi:hypothetical protein